MIRWNDRVHLAGAGTLTLLTAIAYGVGVHPILTDQQDQARLSADADAASRDHGVLQNDIRKIIAETEELQKSQAMAQVDLEDASDINARLVELRGLARERGLTMDGLKPGEPEYDAHYGIVRIQLDGRSQFADLVRFVRDVRARFQDVTVRAVHVRADRDPLEPPTFGLELTWYVLKNNASS